MDSTNVLLQLVGSIALLLWGVRMVRTGMSRAFGALLRRALANGTKSRLRAFGMGLGVTALLQSSTATGLIVSSFAGRSLIAGSMALAMMLGADVGSTLVAQFFSLDHAWIAPLAIAAGVFTFLASKADRVRSAARIAIGLGLMFLALQLLTAASAPLRGSTTMATLLRGLADEPLIAFALAGVLTWLAHSSLAIVLFVMALAGMGVVPLPLALAMVLGANVGGAVAPYLAQTGGTPLARRVPLGNLVMRGAGALAVLPLLAHAEYLVAWVDPAPARVVVNFHLAFNLLVAAAFLPLVGAVAGLCARLLPEPPKVEDPGRPRYLDPEVVEAPTVALACAARETLNLGDRVAEMLRLSMIVFEKDDAKLRRDVELADNAVDRLHEAIKLYLIQVSRHELGMENSRRYVEILSFVTNLEHIGDIIDKNLMELAAKKTKYRRAFSAEGLAELKTFHRRVSENLKLAFNVFMSRDVELAKKLLAEKTAIRAAELAAADSHFARLREGRPESIETSSIHLDIVRDLKRINSHLTSVAYPILETAGALRDSRLIEERAGDAEAPARSPGAVVAQLR
jgi:phosphate:Na+ symporter